MELTASERLALLAAMDKRIAPALKDAKDDARREVMEAYAADGTDRRAVLVGGEKVGEVGVSYSKPAPFVWPGQEKEAVAALRELGLTEEVPAKGWEDHFDLVGGQVTCKDTGEVADWAGWQGKVAKGASLRGCKPDDVLAAFGARIASVDAVALLEGEVA